MSVYQPTLNPDPRLARALVERGALAGAPLHVIDGGSRGGAEPHWSVFLPHLRVVAFEPDRAECDRLNATSEPWQRHVPTALAGSRGTATLHLARLPDSSTLLENDVDFIERFWMGGELEHVGAVEVPTVDLDSVLADEGLPGVDVVKLDVEGAELDILRGGETALGSALMLSLEVWFQRDHIGRPLFGEIDAHLRERSFALFDLRQIARWRRRALAVDREGWIGAGQLMYANALYFRDLPAEVASTGGSSVGGIGALKLAALADVFCYPDFGVEVLEAGVSAGWFTAAEADRHADLLRAVGVSFDSRGKRAVRAAVRTVLPPRVRRRAMSYVQGLLEA